MRREKTLSYIDVVRNVKKGKIAPIYLLMGTEQYILEDAIQQIVNYSLSDDEKEFNLSRYDMKEHPVELAIEEAYTFPFFGEKRVVMIKDAYFLTASKEKVKVEHDLKQLEAYLEQPSPETVFIIVAPYEKLDERKKLVKLAKKNGEFVNGEPLVDKDLKLWILDRAKENKVDIAEEAAERLIELTSADMMLIASEMKKLSLFAGEGKTITKEIVEELVPRSLEQNIFALVDGVMKKEMNKAWAIYLDLLKQKEEPLKIIALMARQFRILYQVKQLASQGYSQKQIAGQIKQHPYVVKLALGQIRSFKDEELLHQLDELATLDYEIKSGKIDKELAVELFFSKRAVNKPRLKA